MATTNENSGNDRVGSAAGSGILSTVVGYTLQGYNEHRTSWVPLATFDFEDDARKEEAEYRQWAAKHKYAWKNFRILKGTMTTEVLPSPNDSSEPTEQPNSK